MFDKLFERFRSHRLRRILVFVEILLMCAAVYVLFAKQTTLGHRRRFASAKTYRQESSEGVTGLVSSIRMIEAQAVHHEKTIFDDDQSKYMKNCPSGSTSTIIDLPTDGRALSQKCQSTNDPDGWICAPGWEKLEDVPFCRRKDITQKETSTITVPVVGPEFSQISDKYKLLFIHIPQTGGLVIEQSHLFDDRRALLNGHYLGGHYSINDFNKDLIQQFHRFCVVRHPCSRLFSTWKYFARRQGNENDNRWVDDHFDETTSSSFNAFVQNTLRPEGELDVESEVHLKSQIDMLFDEQGKFGLDQVLIFERWNESMDDLGERVMADTSPLKQSSEILEDNVSCKNEYTADTWEKMKRLYELDICVLGYSGDINHATDLPLLTMTAESLTARYQSCKEQLTSRKQEVESLNPIEMAVSDEITDEESTEYVNPACIVYTYFQTFENKKDAYHKEASDMLRVWRQAWAHAGWIPRIITEKHAMPHPEYQELKAKFMQLPTVNSKDYELSCFMRYIAMAAVGGGWMTDYDVLPIRLPGCTAPFNDGMLTVHQKIVPSLVSGSQDEYTRVAREMADIDWRSDWDIFNYNMKQPHVSDMLCLVKLVRDYRVRSEHTVASATEVFRTPFNCDNAVVHDKYKQGVIAAGLPPLKVAIHYAHSCMSSLRSNDSALAETWDVEVPTSSFMTSRASVMKIGNDYFRKKCVT